nr:MAG TPA: hypothetical protein [Caudoviricetes sp.]
MLLMTNLFESILLSNLPFIASLFKIFLMYFNIIEWQVR